MARLLRFGIERLRLAARVQPKPPSDSESVLTRWMGIQDANMAGNVHGGTIMKMVDEVAGVAAVRHSGSRVVTAALDRMTFTSRSSSGSS